MQRGLQTASNCGSLQFSSNDLSIVTTFIPQNSGSKKFKKGRTVCVLNKKKEKKSKQLEWELFLVGRDNMRTNLLTEVSVRF